MIIALLLSLTISSRLIDVVPINMEPMHKASPLIYGGNQKSLNRQKLNIRQKRQFSQVELSVPWNGHFSAKNFQQNAKDRLELKKIKSNLQNAIIALPPLHSNPLTNLEVRNTTNSSRGLANSKKIILNIQSISDEDEMISVFVHEIGHVVDLGLLKSINGGSSEFSDEGNPVFEEDPSVNFYRISWQNEKKLSLDANRKDFVSGYAMSNCFEDFAESYLFYRLHGEKFRKLSEKSNYLQKKYEFMRDEVFDKKEFQLEKEPGTFINTLIWDATLLEIDKETFIAKK